MPVAGREEETKIDAALVLHIYQFIIDHGVRTEAGHAYKSINAITDFDGYGVTLTDGTTSLRVLFHNRVATDTPNNRALKRFRDKLLSIERESRTH